VRVTVYYRTVYMRPNAEPRSKTFATRMMANTWIRNYQVEVVAIDEEVV